MCSLNYWLTKTKVTLIWLTDYYLYLVDISFEEGWLISPNTWISYFRDVWFWRQIFLTITCPWSTIRKNMSLRISSNPKLFASELLENLLGTTQIMINLACLYFQPHISVQLVAVKCVYYSVCIYISMHSMSSNMTQKWSEWVAHDSSSYKEKNKHYASSSIV